MRIKEGLESVRSGIWLLLAAALLVSGGCGGKTAAVQFKINSEPEGAHVVYQLVGAAANPLGEWIYIGNTPIRGVRQIDEELFRKGTKVTMKAMRAGYYDQIIEWDGEKFWEEAESKGVIFWTPQLIPHPAGQ